MQLSKQERATFRILAEALEGSPPPAVVGLVAIILKGFAEEETN